MQTIAERFKEELAALLRRYNASLECEDEWNDYELEGQDIQMTVYLHKDMVRLGNYFDGKEVSDEIPKTIS